MQRWMRRRVVARPIKMKKRVVKKIMMATLRSRDWTLVSSFDCSVESPLWAATKS